MNDSATTSDPHAEFFTKIDQLKEMVNECCKAAPAAAQDAVCQAKETAIKAGNQVVDNVRKHPAQAAAIAAAAIGAGLLAWWLVSKR